jgi:hypothetical protein
VQRRESGSLDRESGRVVGTSGMTEREGQIGLEADRGANRFHARRSSILQN